MFIIGVVIIVLSGWIIGSAIDKRSSFDTELAAIGYILAVIGGVVVGIWL